MITEDERFIEIQAILAFSNINIENCTKINDLIIELSKENKILKENAENNDKVVDKVNWENQLLKKENKQLKEVIDRIKEYIEPLITNKDDEECYPINFYVKDVLLSILKEVPK